MSFVLDPIMSLLRLSRPIIRPWPIHGRRLFTQVATPLTKVDPLVASNFEAKREAENGADGTIVFTPTESQLLTSIYGPLETPSYVILSPVTQSSSDPHSHHYGDDAGSFSGEC